MNRHRSVLLLAAVALSTAALGACSKGSPTEPTPLVELESLSAASEVGADDAASSPSAVAEESKRRGRGRGGDGSADDNGGSGRRGRGGRGNGNGNGNGNDDANQPGGQRPGRAGIEFEDSVAAVSGQTIRLASGTRVVVNAQTQWSARGDLFTLAQVGRSAAAGAPTRVEGRGTRQADGAILALTIKAEVDN